MAMGVGMETFALGVLGVCASAVGAAGSVIELGAKQLNVFDNPETRKAAIVFGKTIQAISAAVSLFILAGMVSPTLSAIALFFSLGMIGFPIAEEYLESFGNFPAEMVEMVRNAASGANYTAKIVNIITLSAAAAVIHPLAAVATLLALGALNYAALESN
ncbi:MAG: hypothetical protein HYX48_02645 [Chlamydiales bacterium]|nr:hypothetical protein [Chlamydiales bacterium]